MRPFITRRVLDAVATAYAKPGGTNLDDLTKAVRKAADNSHPGGSRGGAPPLTIDEWAELATYFAAHAYGGRVRQSYNDYIAVALTDLISHTEQVKERLDRLEHGWMQEWAERVKRAPSAASIDALFGETDEVGTEPMTFNQEQP